MTQPALRLRISSACAAALWLLCLAAAPGLLLPLTLTAGAAAQTGYISESGEYYGGSDDEDDHASLESGGREAESGHVGSRVLQTVGGQFENIVIGPQGDRAPAEGLVGEFGGRVVRVSDLGGLGQFSLIAVFPSQAARNGFAAALDQRLPGSGLSLHWTYRFAQATPRLYAPELIGDPAPGGCRLARPIRIGMIDGPVNTDHPALGGARLRHVPLASGARLPAADHGTAVAALMVGEDATGLLAGYARGAELIAVSVFRQTDEGEETSGELIAQALDRLVREGVQIINLSIAGPDSNALRRAIAATAARGVVMVGASGNNRARQVGFPAAAEQVVAVTAVDAARRRFRLANIGAENEFSAPGVDVYAARARGAGYVSGTSFAAPIVTALIAREMARGTTDLASLRNRLQASAVALGGGGRNPEFGWGLARALSC